MFINDPEHTFSSSCEKSKIASALFVTAFVGLALCYTSSCAGEPLNVDLSQKDLNKPTLDYLKEQSIKIPQKDAPAIDSPESAYTLTEVSAPGENVITKYLYNEATKKLTPKYYRVDLKQTTYGEGTQTKYYEFSTDANGNPVLKSVDSPTAGQTVITVKWGKEGYTVATERALDPKSDITNVTFQSLTTDVSGAAIKNDVNNSRVNIAADFIGNSAVIHGGAIKSQDCSSIGSIIGNFINNSAGESGGAILSFNLSAIDNITGDFIGNNAGTFGGAISNTTNSTIGNITGNFIYNFASGGGAISNYTSSSIGSITGDFIGNFASGGGGAIYNRENSVIGNITGDFIGNSASASGGAIYNGAGASIENITGDFINNTTAGEGGAIRNSGTTSITDSTFTGNTSDSFGGAIYNGGVLTINNSIFSKNSAQAWGGALAATKNVDIIDSSFYDNTSAGRGSAFASLTGVTTNIIARTKDSVFANGSSNGFSGGALWIEGGHLNVVGENDHKVIFSNNRSENGGAIGTYDGNIDISNAEFRSNSANKLGGAIYANHYENYGNNTKTLDISNTLFEENSAGGNGGAVAVIKTDDVSYNTTISNSTFKGNTSNNYGGAIYNEGTITSITDTNFSDNTAKYGGAIHNTGNASIGSIGTSSSYASFSGNSATSNGYGVSGGAISNMGSIGDVYANFSNNKTSNSNTVHNQIFAMGGAIFNAQNGGRIDSIHGTFTNNSAESTSAATYGGAIMSYGVIPYIEGSFSGNSVKSTQSGAGGAINLNAGSNTTSVVGEFIGNSVLIECDTYDVVDYHSAGSGGAIATNVSTVGSITGTGEGFKNNFVKGVNADVGGGAISANSNNATDISGKFDSNHVESDVGLAKGGAIYNTKNLGTVSGTFTDNYVQSTSNTASGGAIYNSGTISSIAGEFNENYAIGDDGDGGAIYNNAGLISLIKAKFIGNHAEPTRQTRWGEGGAIRNLSNSTITTIKDSTFEGNYAEATGARTQGGAIDNDGQIDTITNTTFSENYTQSETGDSLGAAIYNGGTIGAISANFEGNYVSGANTYGGAIYNKGTIGTEEDGNVLGITNSTFSGNKAQSTSGYAEGGAIFNSGEITNGITNSSFSENYAQSGTSRVYGGAIFNQGTISQIGMSDSKVSFSDNYAKSTAASGDSRVRGGAIYTNGNITNGIYANFEGNYAESNVDHAVGGAIANVGTIASITGDFINNHVKSSTNYVKGGALFNDIGHVIGNISGDYSKNYAQSTSGTVQGGAISNLGEMGIITGDFSENYVQSTSSSVAGGAIYNEGKIAQIGTSTEKSNFSGNSAKYGGAIYNKGEITNGIYADFSGNSILGTSGLVSGGAIYNAENAIIGGITGNFEGNTARNINESGTNNDIDGAAIVNHGDISFITGSFGNNSSYVKSASSTYWLQGGAIDNDATMGAITGTGNGFYNNSIVSEIDNFSNYGIQGGAIFNRNNATIESISSAFTGNHVEALISGSAEGGAILNSGEITNGITNSSFSGNYAKSVSGQVVGGAIYNRGTLANITGTFSDNYAQSTSGIAMGGAIYNAGAMGAISADFDGNYVSGANAYGGAIYNNTSGLNLTNVVFTDNYAKASSGGTAQGGAIYATGNLTVLADNATSKFQGNYTQVGSADKVYEAVYMASADANFTMNAINGGNILFADNINGVKGYNVTLTGDKDSKIDLSGRVNNASNVTLDTTHLTFATNTFDSEGLVFKSDSGSIDLKDGEYNIYTINGVQTNETVKWNLDIDLSKQKSDVIKTNVASSGTIYIDSVSLEGISTKNDGTYKVQILDTPNPALQLAINSELTGKTLLENYTVYDSAEMVSSIDWEHEFKDSYYYYGRYGQLGLGQTRTENDSIIYAIVSELESENHPVIGDTLHLWNTLLPADGEEKNFNANSASDIYVAGANVGTSVGTVLNVNGVSEGAEKSTIDFDSKYTGFELGEGKTLNIKDVKFANSKNAEEGSVIDASQGAIVNLDGVAISSENSNSAIKNDGTLNFKGNESAINAPISGNGEMNVSSTVKMYENGSNSNENAITQKVVNVYKDGILKIFNKGKINADLSIKKDGEVHVSADGITKDVENNGKLFLADGTLDYEISGDGGNTSIIGKVTSNKTISQAIGIVGGAELTSSASNIGADVENLGTLKLNGGALGYKVSGDGGNTSIIGKVTSNALIEQEIGIVENAELTSSASNIGADVENLGTLKLNGGTLDYEVSGDGGNTSIIGKVTSNALIEQEIGIIQGAELTSKANLIGGEVKNNAGTLKLDDGTLSQKVSGTGSTSIIGQVLSEALIEQEIGIIQGAELTSNADLIGGEVKNNAGTLNLTGGALNKAISGTGSTTISNSVENKAVISQAVTVNSDGNLTNRSEIGNVVNNGTLTSEADKLTGTIENNKTLNLSGILKKSVSGKGTTEVGTAGLTLQNGADIEGILNASEGAQITVSGSENDTYGIGSLRGKGDLEVEGGSLTIRDDATLRNLTNDGNTTIKGSLTATGNIINNNVLSIKGHASAANVTNTGNMSVLGYLIVDEKIDNSGDLDILGYVQADEIENTGTMTVQEYATLNIIRNLITNEDVIVSGTLSVDGNLEAQDLRNEGELSVGGEKVEVKTLTNTNKAEITGNVKVTGKYADSQNSLVNTNTLTVGGTLTTEGNIENSGNLTVTGKVTSAVVTNTSNTSNTSILNFNGGAKLNSLVNSSTANITNGLIANYIENSSTLNLNGGSISVGSIQNTSNINITNSADVQLATAISGLNEKGGNLNITDSTFTTNGNISNQIVTATNSTLNFGDNGNVLKDSTLKMENSVFDAADGVPTNYEMDKLVSSENSRYRLDINLSNEVQSADTFTLVNGGEGFIYLDSFNVTNDCEDNDVRRIQIIKSGSEKAPQLTYNGRNVLDHAQADMSDDMLFAEGMGVCTTKTLYDTLEIRGWRDTFGEWAEFKTGTDKTFAFNKGISYTLTRDVEEFNGKNGTITGNGNVFDVNEHALFEELQEGQTISIADVSIINNKGEMDNKGTLILDNVVLDKNIENNNKLELKNSIDLNNVVNNAAMNYEGNILRIKDFINNSNTTIKATTAIIDNLTNNEAQKVSLFADESDIENNPDVNLSLAGNVISKTVNNNGSLDIDGTLSASESLNNTNSFHVSGNTQAAEMTNSGTAEIDKNLKVNNKLTNSGTITVKGNLESAAVTNENKLTVLNGLMVKEFTNIGSTEAKGNVSAETITNEDTLNVTGNLTARKITNNKVLNLSRSVFNAGRITADESGDINLTDTTMNALDEISNQNISAEGSILNAANPYYLVNDSIALTNSTLNLGELDLRTLNINTMDLSGSTVNVSSSKVDFTTNTMGRISVDSANIDENSVINLNRLNNINYPSRKEIVIQVPFADKSFSQNVSYNGQNMLYTPIYRYGVSYNAKEGDLMFVRGGFFNPVSGAIERASNPSYEFNPGVLATGIAAQHTATSTMHQVFDYVFQNSDNFMNFPLKERLAVIDANKTSACPNPNSVNPRYGINLEGSSWYKPYISFENVNYKLGPKVNSTNYGSLIGFDSNIRPLKNGWASVYSGYAGYNGASQSYSGVHTYLNGGMLGGTLTMYNGNFFNATTLSVGASLAETHSMFGSDNITMLLAGAANKTGYNFEFKEGRFIAQPNLMLSYSFVNPFDYTNSAGVRINSSPLHAIQVAPGLKLMANTKNGWQPYFGVNVVMNFLDKSRVSADGIQLPRMSTRPYVQYGLGVQKVFKDNFIAFGQTMIQSGGRYGISFTAGLRWMLEQNKPNKQCKKTETPKKPIVLRK